MNTLFNKGPSGEQEAIDYLQEQTKVYTPETPPENADSLHTPFFETPTLNTLSSKKYSFESQDPPYLVEFELSGMGNTSPLSQKINTYFNSDEGFSGDHNPKWYLSNLSIRTKEGAIDIPDGISILWIPGITYEEEGVEPKFVNIGKKEIYITGKSGFFSDPKALLGIFHEIGHTQTRSSEELSREKQTILHRISYDDPLYEWRKNQAYEFKREVDANKWMQEFLTPVFIDLGMNPNLIWHYIKNIQMQSYRKMAQKVITLNEEDPVDPTKYD